MGVKPLSNQYGTAMKPVTTLLIWVLLNRTQTLAQSINRLAIQAGYLYSSSTLTPTTTLAIGFPTVSPRPGYYIGLAYEHQLSTLLTSELELTYQQKGYVGRIPYMSEAINTYRYLGLAPLVGMRPIRNLRFLIGPQANLFVNQSTKRLEAQPLNHISRRLELGLLGRASYQVNRVGLTAGYFRGLTAYVENDFYYLTNQNWQLGLSYQISKTKSH